MKVRPLRADDERSAFQSGEPELDRFFVRFAGQNQFRRHLGVTYVAVEGEDLLGFATVAAGAIETEALPQKERRGLPGYPLPVLRLARLATDVRARGKGVGKLLLRHVFAISLAMADSVGCVGVVVDAKFGAEDFYAQFGFEVVLLETGAIESRPLPRTMFLPLRLVRRAMPSEPRELD